MSGRGLARVMRGGEERACESCVDFGAGVFCCVLVHGREGLEEGGGQLGVDGPEGARGRTQARQRRG